MNWNLIEENPLPNSVFDILAMYYEPTLNKFLYTRFANCIQVNGTVYWANPFDKMYSKERTPPIKLTDHGFRPMYWMNIPNLPIGAE